MSSWDRKELVKNTRRWGRTIIESRNTEYGWKDIAAGIYRDYSGIHISVISLEVGDGCQCLVDFVLSVYQAATL
jgi:hypothetical protein